MTHIIEYKGFIGIMNPASNQEEIQGEILNLNETVRFWGNTIDEITISFHLKVDEYIAFCNQNKHSEIYCDENIH